MKNLSLFYIAAIFSTGCLSIGVDSDVALQHNFNFSSQQPIQQTSSPATITVSYSQCYSFDVHQLVQDLDNQSSSLHLSLDISDVEDTISSDQDLSLLSSLSFKITNSKNSLIIVNDMFVKHSSPITIKPQVDSQQLKTILEQTGNQGCLTITGSPNNNFPTQLRQDLTLHLAAQGNW